MKDKGMIVHNNKSKYVGTISGTLGYEVSGSFGGENLFYQEFSELRYLDLGSMN
jgi:hypothetical protein